MHYPHRIRLRGPWECEPLVRHGAREEPPPQWHMTMPCRWREGGLADFAGRVRFRRHFGYPGQIDGYERVWLTFAGVAGIAEVWLNEHYLGRHDGALGPFEHEVTSLLSVRNQLTVEVDDSTGEGGLCGEVALEIRATAFLRGVRAGVSVVGAAVTLQVSGEVVGSATRPLDLYVLLDGANVAYTTVQPVAAGKSFAVTAEAPEGGGKTVRVELVDAAVIWYTVELPAGIPTA